MSPLDLKFEEERKAWFDAHMVREVDSMFDMRGEYVLIKKDDESGSYLSKLYVPDHLQKLPIYR